MQVGASWTQVETHTRQAQDAGPSGRSGMRKLHAEAVSDACVSLSVTMPPAGLAGVPAQHRRSAAL